MERHLGGWWYIFKCLYNSPSFLGDLVSQTGSSSSALQFPRGEESPWKGPNSSLRTRVSWKKPSRIWTNSSKVFRTPRRKLCPLRRPWWPWCVSFLSDFYPLISIGKSPMNQLINHQFVAIIHCYWYFSMNGMIPINHQIHLGKPETYSRDLMMRADERSDPGSKSSNCLGSQMGDQEFRSSKV